MNSKISAKRKALAIATALTLVFSSSVMAFAASSETQTKAQNQCSTSNQMAKVSMTDAQRNAIEQARSASVTEALTQLVKAGTITQEEADKVSASMVKTEKPSETGIFADLTDDQRQALDKERQTVMSEAMTSLVSAGTITQEQADQFTTARNSTTKENTTTRTTLTDAQKTAIREAQENCMTKAVTNLVADGTITQSVADQLNTFEANKKSAMGQNDVLTTDQRTALQDAVKTTFESKLAALVTAGTITQEQSDLFANGNNGFGSGGFDHRGFGGHGRTDCNATQTNSNQTE